MTAKIPPGARDGMRLRFKGKGQPGKSGECGDLYIPTSCENSEPAQKYTSKCRRVRLVSRNAACATLLGPSHESGP